MTKKKIAIIGAGLSGLALAEQLKGKAEITIFEKARGVGGRMSTRYAGDFEFDHGAQYFTARSDNFKNFLKPFIDKEIVQKWTPKIVNLVSGEKDCYHDLSEIYYTASPKMNMLCKTLAKQHEVKLNTRIKKLVRHGNEWCIIDYENLKYGPFDWVVTTAPPKQTAQLLPYTFSDYKLITNARMEGCYSLMLGLAENLDLGWEAARINGSPTIEWICVNSSKPSRNSQYSIVIQTTNSWAEDHISDDQDMLLKYLISETEKLLDCNLKNAKYISLHRWLYSNVSIGLDGSKECLVDKNLNLAVCGDWCIQGRVEAAYLSSLSLSIILNKFFLG